MPKIAVMDNEDVLVAVREVTKDNWVTSRDLKQLAIPDNHDLDKRIGQYKMNWDIGGLVPRRGLLQNYNSDNGNKEEDVLKIIVDSLCLLYVECGKHSKIPDKLKKLARQLSNDSR